MLKSLNKMLKRKENFKELTNKTQADILVDLLKEHPGQIKLFQESYQKIMDDVKSKNLFEQKADSLKSSKDSNLHEMIVQELLVHSRTWSTEEGPKSYLEQLEVPFLTPQELMDYNKNAAIPIQLGGKIAKVDISPSEVNKSLEYYIRKFQENQEMMFYHKFRQGLDILDISPEVYGLLSCDPNSMSNWLPQIQAINNRVGFFKIPKTKILKVPLTLLQTTRSIEYSELSPATVAIINDYIYRVMDLDEDKSYFIKTGTFSSKFEFRNAHVPAGQEVRELGSYLYYIQQQANQMASMFNNAVMYGVSSNNDWVVREYIEPKETAPTIYNGLPLRLEFRCFVDFDDKELLSVVPYWEPATMRKHFSKKMDNPHDLKAAQDYIAFSAYEPTLSSLYEKHVNTVAKEVEKFLEASNNELKGQWSMDVMMNGDDFYLIDMALAANSAFSDSIPEGKLKPVGLPFANLLQKG